MKAWAYAAFSPSRLASAAGFSFHRQLWTTSPGGYRPTGRKGRVWTIGPPANISGWSSHSSTFLPFGRPSRCNLFTGTTRGTIPEIWFPRLIVVPVYSQEVAGVRKEKERLTAAPNPEWGSVEDLGCSGFLFLHSYTRCNLILTVRGCNWVVDEWILKGTNVKLIKPQIEWNGQSRSTQFRFGLSVLHFSFFLLRIHPPLTLYSPIPSQTFNFHSMSSFLLLRFHPIRLYLK